MSISELDEPDLTSAPAAPPPILGSFSLFPDDELVSPMRAEKLFMFIFRVSLTVPERAPPAL